MQISPPPLLSCTALAGLKWNGNISTPGWLSIDDWVDFRKWPWLTQASTWPEVGSFSHTAHLWHRLWQHTTALYPSCGRCSGIISRCRHPLKRSHEVGNGSVSLAVGGTFWQHTLTLYSSGFTYLWHSSIGVSLCFLDRESTCTRTLKVKHINGPKSLFNCNICSVAVSKSLFTSTYPNINTTTKTYIDWLSCGLIQMSFKSCPIFFTFEEVVTIYFNCVGFACNTVYPRNSKSVL